MIHTKEQIKNFYAIQKLISEAETLLKNYPSNKSIQQCLDILNKEYSIALDNYKPLIGKRVIYKSFITGKSKEAVITEFPYFNDYDVVVRIEYPNKGVDSTYLNELKFLDED